MTQSQSAAGQPFSEITANLSARSSNALTKPAYSYCHCPALQQTATTAMRADIELSCSTSLLFALLLVRLAHCSAHVPHVFASRCQASHRLSQLSRPRARCTGQRMAGPAQLLPLYHPPLGPRPDPRLSSRSSTARCHCAGSLPIAQQLRRRIQRFIRLCYRQRSQSVRHCSHCRQPSQCCNRRLSRLRRLSHCPHFCGHCLS